MRVCFLAERTCKLSVNGAYYGPVDGFERWAEIEPSEELFCELDPAGDFLPVKFILSEEFLLSPPPCIKLYHTEQGTAIYAGGFLRADRSLKVVWQRRFGGVLLTLAVQGKLQLYFRSGEKAALIDLPDGLEDCDAEPCADGFLLRTEEMFAVVSGEGELLLVEEGKVLSFEETIRAEVPFHDSMGHVARCEWRAGKLVSCAVGAKREPTEATLALALFECALIGADCTPFLSPALAEKGADLKGYLGDFRSVVLTGERDRIGLVYERRPRVFDVKYFRVTREDGKISNISPD